MFTYRLLLGVVLVVVGSIPFHSGQFAAPGEASPLREQPAPTPTNQPLRLDQLANEKPASDDSSEAPGWRSLERHARGPYTNLGVVGGGFYAKGQYKEALEAYTRWVPRDSCGNCLLETVRRRYYRIVLCHLHLEGHVAAVRVCLAAMQRDIWSGNANDLLVQMYREAGQLDDLRSLLNAMEASAIRAHPKWWLLTSADRDAVLARLRTSDVRYFIDVANSGKLAPWPEGAPRPKPGSLPKTLPK